jgi:hypothetical protein
MSLHIHCAPAPTTAPLASAGNSNAQPTVSAVLSAPGAPPPFHRARPRSTEQR